METHINFNQKVLNLTQMNLVIKFIVFIVISSSCSSGKQNLYNDINYVIDKELSRNMSYIGNQKVYLEFNQNAYMSEFLMETKHDLQNSSSLEKKLGNEIFEVIFNLEQLDYLIKQSQISNTYNYEKLKFSANIIYYSKSKLDTEDENILELASKQNVFLSKAIFTKNKEFCLIAFSNGVMAEMQGGISVYKKDANSWKFVTTFNDWVE